jgi:uncharacterized protein YjbI with pentapeptide repeats
LSGSGMENMDLSRADLSGTDLRGAQMNNTNLSGAILYDADLSPKSAGGYDGGTDEYLTDLTGANLSDADLTGAVGLNTVIWSNTTCPDGTNTDTNGDDTCEGHLTP